MAREILPYVKEGKKLPADLKKKLTETYGIGETTLNDIIDELGKPNRDPRDGYPAPIMQKGVVKFEDLTVGMKVTGKIKNVVDFGAFVDIGLHETGLIHISELSDTFVSDPMDVIKVGDVKEFTIIALDTDRRRISLSLKSDAGQRLAGASTGSAVSSEHKAGGKKVVVIKKGSGAANSARPANRDANRDRPRRDFDRNDSGETYNPFALAFSKGRK